MKLKRTIKFKLFDRILVYGFITWIEKVKGLTSKVPDRENSHYVLLDFDNIEYYDVCTELERLCIKFNINGFVIFSDREKSYRCFSDTIVTFRTLLKVMLEAEGVDFMFFVWTVKRGYATIRVGEKKGRKKNDIIGSVGKVNTDLIREKFKFIQYETDLEAIEK